MLTNLLFEAMLLAAASMPLDARVKVHFQVVDTSGGVVSNAVATVVTRRDRIENMGHGGSPMRRVTATTDADGRASVAFPCYSGEISGEVLADGFYPERKRDIYFKCAKGSSFFARLLEREKTLRFTLRRKIHPVPCLGYGAGDVVRLPAKNGRFGFDLEKGAWVAPHGKGKVADFWVRHEGPDDDEWADLEFDGAFNGAYKLVQEPSTSFKSAYRADTNRVYAQKMPLWRWRRDAEGKIHQFQLVSDREYLVIRSRSVVDAEGRLRACHYSKIYGGIMVFEELRFMTMVFNPRVNDPNLEFDTKRNLRRESTGLLLP